MRVTQDVHTLEPACTQHRGRLFLCVFSSIGVNKNNNKKRTSSIYLCTTERTNKREKKRVGVQSNPAAVHAHLFTIFFCVHILEGTRMLSLLSFVDAASKQLAQSESRPVESGGVLAARRDREIEGREREGEKKEQQEKDIGSSTWSRNKIYKLKGERNGDGILRAPFLVLCKSFVYLYWLPFLKDVSLFWFQCRASNKIPYLT